MQSFCRGWIVGVTAVALFAGLPGCGKKDAPPKPVESPKAQPPRPEPPPASQPVPPLATNPANSPSTPEQAGALTLMEQGLAALAEGKLLTARGLLADALNSNCLPPAQADITRARLADLANKTLFSRTAMDGDPCVYMRKLGRGENLNNLERAEKLHIPTQLILLTNGLADSTKLQAGQMLKLIRGPFHAVVSKSGFSMDLYLQEGTGGRMLFVRRLAVGIGKDGSTPVGRWRVVFGGKLTHAPWTPPPASNMKATKILWGQKDYPLGRKGYWIALEGIEGNPNTKDAGFGIHGTNDPTSIGKAMSLGCIRLADDDIETVYGTLYEVHSTITIVP